MPFTRNNKVENGSIVRGINNFQRKINHVFCHELRDNGFGKKVRVSHLNAEYVAVPVAVFAKLPKLTINIKH